MYRAKQLYNNLNLNYIFIIIKLLKNNITYLIFKTEMYSLFISYISKNKIYFITRSIIQVS